MIRLPAQTLPALTAALALLLASEWLLPGARLVSPSKLPAFPTTLPDNAADAALSQWGDTALARPLFHPDRRPVAAAGTNADTSLPRLSAIIIIGGTPAAVFAAAGQKPQVVGAGGTIDGYRLEHIGPNTVELLGPEGELTVHPQFITATPENQMNAIPAINATPAITEENNN